MTLRRHWLTTTLLAFVSTPSEAGQTIEQAVKVSLNGASRLSTHTWHIDNEQFDLVVTADESERRFIFNGRVMYACGKLNTTQIKALSELNIQDQGMVKKFQTGVCQEVPSNFLVRFFLSPVSAIETIDFSDGLKLTLEIDSFVLTKTQTKKIISIPAAGFSRSFELKKTSETGKTTQTIKESFFAGGALNTRQNLWSELSKTLMRQPKGIQLLKQLKLDREQVQGLILENETIFESEQSGGGKNSGTISVTTTKIVTADISPVRFKIPFNYEVFSPENLQLLANSVQSKNSTDQQKKEKEDINILDKMQSVFFCAIAGALGCFSK